MTMFIFAGDMLVMAFMIGLAFWISNKGNVKEMDAIARIPLEDEEHHG